MNRQLKAWGALLMVTAGVGVLAGCATEATNEALGSSPIAPQSSVSSTASASGTVVEPVPTQSVLSTAQLVAMVCQAFEDTRSWDDWVLIEPGRSAFVAREQRRMAQDDEEAYRAMAAFLRSGDTVTVDQLLAGDASVALLWAEANDRANAAGQLRFNIGEWLKSRNSQDLTLWRYRFGHYTALIESRPVPCS